MPKAPEELQVITKAHDFTVWTSNHIAKFPRSHRFTLGDRLELRVLDLLELLLRAKYTADRGDLLREANLVLEFLRFQFRLGKDLKCLSLESYGYASRTLNEIGQLVGGWIKSSGARRKEVRDEKEGKAVAGVNQLHEPVARGGKGAARQADAGQRGPLPF
jgi:hypothetical protein